MNECEHDIVLEHVIVLYDLTPHNDVFGKKRKKEKKIRKKKERKKKREKKEKNNRKRTSD